VGFQKSVTYVEQQFHAARSYSLIKPPRTCGVLEVGHLRRAACAVPKLDTGYDQVILWLS